MKGLSRIFCVLSIASITEVMSQLTADNGQFIQEPERSFVALEPSHSHPQVAYHVHQAPYQNQGWTNSKTSDKQTPENPWKYVAKNILMVNLANLGVGVLGAGTLGLGAFVGARAGLGAGGLVGSVLGVTLGNTVGLLAPPIIKTGIAVGQAVGHEFTKKDKNKKRRPIRYHRFKQEYPKPISKPYRINYINNGWTGPKLECLACKKYGLSPGGVLFQKVLGQI